MALFNFTRVIVVSILGLQFSIVCNKAELIAYSHRKGIALLGTIYLATHHTMLHNITRARSYALWGHDFIRDYASTT